MWYEIMLGLGVLGVLMVFAGCYRKGLSMNDRAEPQAEEKRWLWSFVLGVVALWAVSAAAEPVSYGDFCWRLFTFEDRLKVEVVVRDPSQADFALYGTWIGQIFPDPPTYVLQGGGSGVTSFDGSEFSIEIPFRNTSTFFMNQRIGRFTAVLNAANLSGEWYADFVGGTGAPFVVRGTLSPVDCDAPNPPVSSTRSSVTAQSEAPQGGRLAGE